MIHKQMDSLDSLLRYIEQILECEKTHEMVCPHCGSTLIYCGQLKDDTYSPSMHFTAKTGELNCHFCHKSFYLPKEGTNKRLLH